MHKQWIAIREREGQRERERGREPLSHISTFREALLCNISVHFPAGRQEKHIFNTMSYLSPLGYFMLPHLSSGALAR